MKWYNELLGRINVVYQDLRNGPDNAIRVLDAIYDGKRLAREVIIGKQTGLSLLRDRCQIGGIVKNYDTPTVAGPINLKIEIIEYLKENFDLEIFGVLGNDDEICIWHIRRG